MIYDMVQHFQSVCVLEVLHIRRSLGRVRSIVGKKRLVSKIKIRGNDRIIFLDVTLDVTYGFGLVTNYDDDGVGGGDDDDIELVHCYCQSWHGI